jgi:beta-galactosidase
MEGYGAENATDGDPNTIWHTAGEGEPPGFPHELIVQFGTPTQIKGFTALPRQDGNHNGWIKDYALYASSDGETWGEPIVKGVFVEDANLKTVAFTAPVTARAVKLVASSGYAKGPWTSLAEFHILLLDPKPK